MNGFVDELERALIEATSGRYGAVGRGRGRLRHRILRPGRPQLGSRPRPWWRRGRPIGLILVALVVTDRKSVV